MSEKNIDQQPEEEKSTDSLEERLTQAESEEILEGKSEKKTGRKPKASRKRKQVKSPDEETKAQLEEEQEADVDDLFADIRQSLAAEEGEEKEKGLFKKITDRFKKKPKKEEEPVEEPSRQLSIREEYPEAPETQPKKKTTTARKEEQEAIEEFFSDLEALAKVDIEPIPASMDERLDALGDAQEENIEEIPTPEPEDVTLEPTPKKTLRQLSVKPESEDDFQDLREVALEEYDETPLEPATERKVSIQDEVKTTVRELRPLERILLIIVFVITVGVLLSSGVYFITTSMPEPTPTVTPIPSTIPVPVKVSLPGGWEFSLHRGKVVDGKWNPEGAEWLDGTEISRWIALPYSLQLEAVLRTLKADDEIVLTMSNLDRLTYHVQSIEKMTMEQVQATNIKTPSLLIILAQGNPDSETKWVIMAVP